MLDLKYIRENVDRVRKALADRGEIFDLDRLLELDKERRSLISELDQLRHQRKKTARELGRRKAAGEDISSAREAARRIGERIAVYEDRLREVEAGLDRLLMQLPNLPHPTVPVGSDASANRVVRKWGDQKRFPFEPRPHWEIGEKLGILDFGRAARISGSGFALFSGVGALLERSLINFMLDVHTREHGYREIWPPVLCNPDTATGTGQLPKMADDMYLIEKDALYLAPTAEVPVTNIYREEIISEPLPLYLVAYTPCFRREAGAAGRETRGLIRVHQFDKVELVKFVEPAESYAELEHLVRDAEDILQRLGLTYRVVELCTGDLSFAAAKCYDIELWAPAYGDWLEVSSCSNFEDFQARRAGIRYRDRSGSVAYVHTLNGSGVALARLVAALLENYQQADGSVEIPQVLRPYMHGLERIEPPVS
ncbi:MAG: serine--tRNA ligase [Verrucomicrobia bacterium]|nr:MAG: serine--tRNA ligase [Verrucomicrobiota bacterium]